MRPSPIGAAGAGAGAGAAAIGAGAGIGRRAGSLAQAASRAFAGFGNCVYPGGLLERRVKELVIITASHTNECQFCTNSHCDLVSIASILDEPLTLVAQVRGLLA